MGAGPSTTTICPYPYTFPSSGADQQQPASPKSCTITYGEALDPMLGMLQVVFAVYFFAASCTFANRIRLLRKARRNWLSVSSGRIFLASGLFSLIHVVEMSVFGGFRGVCPPALWILMDECGAALIFVQMVEVVDSWMMVKNSFTTRSGLGAWTKLAASLVPVAIYPGIRVVALLDAQRYVFYEGIMMLLTTVYVGIFHHTSRRAMFAIIQALSCAEATMSTNRSQELILTLHRKYSKFACLSVTGCVIGVGAAVACFASSSYEWAYPIEAQIDPLLIMHRIMYAVVVMTALYMYKAPKTKKTKAVSPATSSSRRESSAVAPDGITATSPNVSPPDSTAGSSHDATANASFTSSEERR